MEKAAKAWAKVRVLVIMAAHRPIIATAPRGSGAVMIPMMVATKTARRCQAWVVMPAGWGQKKSPTPTATARPRVFKLAPFHSAGAAAAAFTTAGVPLLPVASTLTFGLGVVDPSDLGLEARATWWVLLAPTLEAFAF